MTTPTHNLHAGTSIKVLGSGCKNCNKLEANARTALDQLGINGTVEHITDFAQIASYGVMSVPALMINDTVVLRGKVAQTDEIVELLKQANAS